MASKSGQYDSNPVTLTMTRPLSFSFTIVFALEPQPCLIPNFDTFAPLLATSGHI